MKTRNRIANKKFIEMVVLLGMSFAMVNCTEKKGSFSILPEEDTFKQDTTYVPRKIDILWVVDNSGSMETSQANLTANFEAFISRIAALKFDYHVGVIATDAWKSKFNTSLTHSNLKDGVSPNKSGVFVIDQNTTDVIGTFVKNASLGVNGSGDERAFQSFVTSLLDEDNSSFRREDAFLAIIILSDEDDFSHDTSAFSGSSYSYPGLHAVSDYVSWLTEFTDYENAPIGQKNFSVSTISILDQACADTLNADGWTRYVGTRYIELAELTGGVKGSLCGNFGETLEIISDSIIQANAVFPLSRIPIPETIAVTVNGEIIMQDSKNGWSYDEESNSIIFHGSKIPAAGSLIDVDFDPVGIKL